MADILSKLELKAKPFYHVDKTLRYHVWGHIEQAIKAHSFLFGEPTPEVKLALLYHDTVYVPKSPPGVNESLSALVFQRQAADYVARGKLDSAFVKDVMTLIECTSIKWHLNADLPHDISFIKAHGIVMSVNGTLLHPKLADSLCRLLDCDLSSLGSDYDSFVKRQDSIVHEYAATKAISHEQLLEGRQATATFLLGFLKKPSIYLTDEGKRAYEDCARSNIVKYAREQGVYIGSPT